MGEVKWTKREALACAYCWAEFWRPEDRPDTPEQYWLRCTEPTRQECRKIVKDRHLLAVAFREAAPVFPEGTQEQRKAVAALAFVTKDTRVSRIISAVFEAFRPQPWSNEDRAALARARGEP